jgi:RNA polymerase sigma-70 factor, ECF subfamily
MLYLRGSASPDAPPQELADVAQGRGGHGAEVLAGLYEQYYDRVLRYIVSRVGNRDTAEDLAGDVFVRAVESFGSFKDKGVPVQAWLFRIAHNLVVDHYRRSSYRRSTPIDDAMEIAGPADPEAEVEHSITMEQVRTMMQRLNPAQQEVIALRFMGGLSAEEAGAVMGRTSGAIRELQRTALKALRSHLGPQMQGYGLAGPAGQESGGGE